MTIKQTLLKTILDESSKNPVAKLFIHRGTCGDATDIVSICEKLGIIELAVSLNAEIL